MASRRPASARARRGAARAAACVALAALAGPAASAGASRAPAGASAASSKLLYSTCTMPACADSQLRAFDLASRASALVALLPAGLADLFESNTLYLPAEGVALMAVQHVADFTGALVEVDVAGRRVASVFNASRCLALALDPADASGDTVACLAVDVGGPCGGAGVECLELRHISRARRTDTLVAAFAAGSMPYSFSAYDAARGVLVASFTPVSGAGNDTLFEVDVHTGAVVRATAYDLSLVLTAMQWDAGAGGRVFVVAGDDSLEETYFGVLNVTAATATPLSLFNLTQWVQYSSASALDADAGVFYTTAAAADFSLHLLGLRTADGAIVYDAVVDNPFVDLQVVPAAR